MKHFPAHIFHNSIEFTALFFGGGGEIQQINHHFISYIYNFDILNPSICMGLMKSLHVKSTNLFFFQFKNANSNYMGTNKFKRN